MSRTLTAFVLAGSMLALAGVAQAAVITQNASDDYLAYEAEADATVNGGWTEISDASASGGKALQATATGGNAKGNPQWFQHELTFVTAGTYDLWLRVSTPSQAGNAAFRANDFNVNESDGGSFANLQTSPEAGYKWITAGSYVVNPLSTGSGQDVNDVVEYTLKYQETNFIADRFLFLLSTSDRTSGTFDSLPNSIPEPASLALVGLGGLLLVRRRRA